MHTLTKTVLMFISLSLFSSLFASEALIEAAKKGDVAALNAALATKVDVDVRHNNATALMWASKEGHEKVVTTLIST